MTNDPWREILEDLVKNFYDSLLQYMDAIKEDHITRDQLMKLKLEWQSRMDIT